MTKSIFFLLLITTGLTCHSQENRLLVHFNNAEDRNLKQKSIETLIDFEQFRSVASQTSNADTRVHLVFYDPAVQGALEIEAFNSASTSEYLNNWVSKYESYDKRILFFFTKESQTYQFQTVYVTPNLVESQLPEIVVSYIKDEIIKKETSVENMIQRGMKAFMNAFDQRFKDRLVENAASLFDNSKYYKGYSCIDFDYYYFERVLSNNTQASGCNLLYYGNDYKVVVPFQPPYNFVDASQQSVVMDRFADKPLAYKYKNVATGANQDIQLSANQLSNISHYDGTKFEAVSLIGYTYDYLDFSQPATSYTGLKDNRMPSAMKNKLLSIYWNPYQFKEWRYNDALNSPLVFEQATKACISTHKVKVFSGRIRAGIDPVDEKHGVSTYGSERFDEAQPTWCNVFARELSRIVFGSDAFPAKSCKDLLNTEFKTKKELYVDLFPNSDSDKNSTIVWNLINKGYPIYFVSNRHIDTGFPDGYAFESYRHRHLNDKRYDEGSYSSKENSNILHENPNKSENIVVGAGSKVGFKESWNWIMNEAKIYLYLGYLKQ